MKFILILTTIIYLNLSNIYCLAKEVNQDESILKVGLIVPLSGKYQEVGKSVLNSIRLALSKINDDQIEIFPKDNYSSPEKTLLAAKQLEKEGIQIVIGPILHQNLIYLKEVKNLFFLSLSNKTKTIPNNTITTGINANSQLNAIINFLKKENLNKTIVLIPRSNFEEELRNALVKSKYKFLNIYSYDNEPDKLTSQIEQITAYNERKKKLERRIEILEKSDIHTNKEELENLKKKYTLGEINFDSVVIADFGENLKSVINTFSFSDVTSNDATFVTLNQWFDKTLLKENSANQIFFPSINLINYSKFREVYLKNFNKYPSQISILSYDLLGLIYYLKKIKGNDSIKNIFDKKISYKGEVGEFSFENKMINHRLDIYQIFDNKFVEVN